MAEEAMQLFGIALSPAAASLIPLFAWGWDPLPVSA